MLYSKLEYFIGNLVFKMNLHNKKDVYQFSHVFVLLIFFSSSFGISSILFFYFGSEAKESFLSEEEPDH